MEGFQNTRISWIGSIPAHWSVKKLKYLSSKIERGTSPEYTDDEMTMVVNQATFSKGVFDVSDIRYSTKPANTSRGLLEKNDVLLASTGGGVLGKTFLYEEDGTYVADGHVTIIRSLQEHLIPEYLYFFLYVNYETINAMLAVGSTNQTELQRDLLANMKIPLPPLCEQKIICDYLHGKCAEIDTLLSDVQLQIDTLEEYKHSIITKAVTKGILNGMARKDSGIEWVGPIPAHWKVMPNKYIMHKVKDICPVYDGEDILSLTMNGVIVRDLDAGGKMPATFDGYQRVKPGNLLMCLFDIDVTPRCIGLIKNHGLTSPAYSQFVMHEGAVAEYFYYYYLMVDYTKELLHMAKNLRHSLTEDQLGAISVPVPPVEEQREIADYLDDKITEIDGIIAQKKEQLSILEAYKKSLIFEYVTGKKEVPAPITAVMVDPNVILLGKLPKLLSKQKGKIYNQKVLYLLNTYLGLNLGVQYYRYKHGPYDIMLDSYIDTLVENGWCVKTIQNGAENLEIGPNYGVFEEKFGSCFSERDAEINSLIQFVQPMKRSQIERVATLFAVWNDMILDGKSNPTDAEIVSEVMSGWTENKANFAYDTWIGTLNKMGTNGIVPKGQGLHTLPRDC